MTGMARQVRMGPPEVLHRIATDMSEVRTRLAGIGSSPHTVLDVLPVGTPPGEVSALFADLSRASEELMGRLGALASRADRSMALVAYALAYVATRFPETDADNAAHLAVLSREATAAAPPPADPLATDPRFVSPVKPR